MKIRTLDPLAEMLYHWLHPRTGGEPDEIIQNMGVPYVKEEMKQAGDGADKKPMRAKGNEKADDFMAKDINQNSIRTVDEKYRLDRKEKGIIVKSGILP